VSRIIATGRAAEKVAPRAGRLRVRHPLPEVVPSTPLTELCS